MDIVATKEEMKKALGMVYEWSKEYEVDPSFIVDELYEDLTLALNRIKADGNR